MVKAEGAAKTCFVICPIGSAGTDVRKRSDQVLKHIISKAVEPLGDETLRADQISEPGVITTQVIQYVIDAPLVVADLSQHNPNVFYELAIRHAMRKPLVILITRGEQIPFDVSANRAIQYDLADLDTLDQARSEIAKQVKTLESGTGKVDNPISNTLELKTLKASGDPEQRTIADIMEILQGMRSDITNLKRSPTPSSQTYFRNIRDKIIDLDQERLAIERSLAEVEHNISHLKSLPEDSPEKKLKLTQFQDQRAMLRRTLDALQEERNRLGHSLEETG